MEERGIDRRVRKTKRQLRQALMDLMSEKPSKSISVRELAERADINRGTFYIHYKDVSDLLQRLEDEMAERLILVCKKYAYSTSEVDAFPYLTELYRFARDNADLCLVLLGPNGDRAYTERICGILRSYFLRDFLARFYSGSSDRLDYFCSFIVSGNLTLTLTPVKDKDPREDIFFAAAAARCVVISSEQAETPLESIFLSLTDNKENKQATDTTEAEAEADAGSDQADDAASGDTHQEGGDR